MTKTYLAPHISLNNGVELPALGLGVFQSAPADTVTAVESAIATGYRLIDTAASYANEREVGEGLRRSGISRDEVFIETKIWISDYGYESTLHAFEKSARKIGVDQLDLLLLHQPLSSAFERTLDAYRALEKLLAEGKVRAIGVSNFMPAHLDRLLAATSVVPAVNQSRSPPSTRSTPAAAAGRSPTASPSTTTGFRSLRRDTRARLRPPRAAPDAWRAAGGCGGGRSRSR